MKKEIEIEEKLYNEWERNRIHLSKIRGRYLSGGKRLTEENKTYIHDTLYCILEGISVNNHGVVNNAMWILQNLTEIFLSSDYPSGFDDDYDYYLCYEMMDLQDRLGKVIDFFGDVIGKSGKTKFCKYVIALLKKLIINAVNSKDIKTKRDLAIMITRYY